MKGREIFEGDILEFQDEGVRDVIVWRYEFPVPARLRVGQGHMFPDQRQVFSSQ